MNEPLNRREFQRQVAMFAAPGAALIALDVAGPSTAAASDDRRPGGIRSACNFQRSFMTWDIPPRPDPRPYARHNMPLGNKARIQLDALIDVIDVQTGDSERFVLIAPCRTEWVYAKDHLFQIPSREYRNIYSQAEERSMSRSITYEDRRSPARSVGDRFRSLDIDVQTFAASRALATPAEINAATGRNVPLIGRTELGNEKSLRRYVMQYPIKTMNFRPENRSFQVDTGPILAPDLTATAVKTIEKLAMAHIAYNRMDRAELILRRPTAVSDDGGRELCRVLHYSEVRQYAAATKILTGEDG